MQKKYDWLLFDADETLFDYPSHIGLARLAARYGIAWTDEDYVQFQAVNQPLWRAYQEGRIDIGQLEAQRFADLEARTGQPAPQLNRELQLEMAQLCNLLPGARELLAAAHGAGIRIGQLQAQLLYSTEVNRPTYRQLSKNVLYGSRYTWQMGNPLLRPEYVHELTLQGVWRIVQFQFGYSDTRNAIINWGTQSAEHRAVSIMSYRNLPSVKEMRLAVVVSKGFGAWTPQLTTVMNKQFLHLTTGTGQYNLSSPIWIVKLSNNFQIGRTLSLFLSADYQSPGDYRNVHLSRNMWSVNFNAVKTLYHDRLSVQLKVNDIFNSKKDGNEIYNDQMVMHLLNRYDFRAVSVTLRYKLNSKDYKSHSHSDADQEIRRL